MGNGAGALAAVNNTGQVLITCLARAKKRK
jgi:hypothetical protein